VVAINRDKSDLNLNRDFKLWMSPSIAILGDPCNFLIDLAKRLSSDDYVGREVFAPWLTQWKTKDTEKNATNLV